MIPFIANRMCGCGLPETRCVVRDVRGTSSTEYLTPVGVIALFGMVAFASLGDGTHEAIAGETSQATASMVSAAAMAAEAGADVELAPAEIGSAAQAAGDPTLPRTDMERDSDLPERLGDGLADVSGSALDAANVWGQAKLGPRWSNGVLNARSTEHAIANMNLRDVLGAAMTINRLHDMLRHRYPELDVSLLGQGAWTHTTSARSNLDGIGDTAEGHAELFGTHFTEHSDLELAFMRADVQAAIEHHKSRPAHEVDPENLRFMEFVEGAIREEQKLRLYEREMLAQYDFMMASFGADGDALVNAYTELRGDDPRIREEHPHDHGGETAEEHAAHAHENGTEDMTRTEILDERKRISDRIAAIENHGGQFNEDLKLEAFSLAARQSELISEQLARGDQAIARPTTLSDATLSRMNRMGELSMPLDSFVYSDDYAMREKHPIHGDRRMHWGVDFSRTAEQKAAGILPPIKSVLPGKVIDVGYRGGAGLTVKIQHDNGYQTRYLHLSEANVSVGERVGEGQQIGVMGSTGGSTGPHLHFELKTDPNGGPVDPAPFFGLSSQGDLGRSF